MCLTSLLSFPFLLSEVLAEEGMPWLSPQIVSVLIAFIMATPLWLVFKGVRQRSWWKALSGFFFFFFIVTLFLVNTSYVECTSGAL